MSFDMEQTTRSLDDQAEPNTSACKPMDCFKSAQWWRNAAFMSIIFVPSCALPAGMWLVFLGLIVFPIYFLIKTFNGPSVEFSRLLQVFGVYIACTVVAFPLLFWSVGTWLVRLTAFCSAFVSFSGSELRSTKLRAPDVREKLKFATKRTEAQKGFLTKFWSTLTAFLLLPCAVLVVSMLILAATSPGIFGPSPLKLPFWAVALTYVLLWSSFALTTIVSFVGLCVSANSLDNPIQRAKESMQLSIQRFFPLFVLSMLSVLVATLLTFPTGFVRSVQTQDVFAINISWWTVVEEVWRAVSSTAVLTFTMAPICEYLRGSTPSEKT